MEREVLVESFDELHVGMIVRIKSCVICGCDHRGMLTGERRNQEVFSVRRQRITRIPLVFCMSPTPHDIPGTGGYAVTPRLVRHRRVYRVIDSLDVTQVEKTRRSRPVAA